MRTISKKILSLLLVAVLVLSAIPFAAFADEPHTCGEATAVREGLALYKCSCGKYYTEADCRAELRVADFGSYAPLIAYLDALDAAGNDAEFLALLNELGMNPNTPAPLGETDEVKVKFALQLEKPDGTTTKVSIEKQPKGNLTEAPKKSDFNALLSANNIKSEDYIWPSSLTWTNNGKEYPGAKSVNALTAGGFTANEGVYEFTSEVVNLENVRMTVQVQWKEGSTTKTISISETAVTLKPYKNYEIIDYLYGKVPTVSEANNMSKKILDALDSGTITDVDGKTYNISGFKWNQDWYVGNSKVDKQKFTGRTIMLAKLDADKCVVTFNANGGSCDTTSASVNTNSAYSALPTPTAPTPTAPTDPNKIFVGWFEILDGGSALPTLKIDPTTGRVKASDAYKQYFTTTVFTHDVTLHAGYIKEADIKLNIYSSRTATTPVSGKIRGVPVGAPLTTAKVTAAMNNTSGMIGPFADDSVNGIENYTPHTAQIENFRKVSFYKDKGTGYSFYQPAAVEEEEAIAVFGSNLSFKASTNIGDNYNLATSGSGSNNPSGSSGSSATPTTPADPSNPKTGDAQRVQLNVAAVALAVATVALGTITTVMFVRRKQEI